MIQIVVQIVSRFQIIISFFCEETTIIQTKRAITVKPIRIELTQFQQKTLNGLDIFCSRNWVYISRTTMILFCGSPLVVFLLTQESHQIDLPLLTTERESKKCSLVKFHALESTIKSEPFGILQEICVVFSERKAQCSNNDITCYQDAKLLLPKILAVLISWDSKFRLAF